MQLFSAPGKYQKTLCGDTSDTMSVKFKHEFPAFNEEAEEAFRSSRLQISQISRESTCVGVSF